MRLSNYVVPGMLVAGIGLGSACTSTSWTAMRTNFPPDARLSVSCVEYPDAIEKFDAKLRHANRQGWRPSMVGSSVTAFLFFVSRSTVVCFEKLATSGPASSRQPDVKAPGEDAKSCQQSHARCLEQGGSAEECLIGLQRCDDAIR